MAKRITEKPIRHRFLLTESAANTYTEVDFVLPVVVIGANKVQGVEIMQLKESLQYPDLEPGQDNRVRVQLVRDAQTTIIAETDTDNLLALEYRLTSEDATAIEGFTLQESPRYWKEEFVTDEKQGDGLILAERRIHLGILGTGNANAKLCPGSLYYHIIELTANDLIIQLALDDDL